MSEYEVSIPIKNQRVFSKVLQQQLNWLVWNWHSKEMAVETPPDRRWWEFWKLDKTRQTSLLVIGRYLLEGIDDFVRIASSKSSGKPGYYKLTILDATGSLYDTVIRDAKLPWWSRPFGGSIKTLFINVIASLLIDYIIRHSTSS